MPGVRKASQKAVVLLYCQGRYPWVKKEGKGGTGKTGAGESESGVSEFIFDCSRESESESQF